MRKISVNWPELQELHAQSKTNYNYNVHAKSPCFSLEMFISILKAICIYLIYIIPNWKKDTSTMHFGYTISATKYTRREKLRRKGHCSSHLEKMHSIRVRIHGDDAWWQMWEPSCSHCIKCYGAKSQRVY